jgi:hypothetical protein
MTRILPLLAAAFFSSTFLSATAAADDSVLAWADGKDSGVAKSTMRQHLVEGYDADGNVFGKMKRYTWGDSSFAQYVDPNTGLHVMVETNFTGGVRMMEDGVESPDFSISPEAALLIIRIQEQADQTSARIPMRMVTATVDCDVAWNGYGAELSNCYLSATNDG